MVTIPEPWSNNQNMDPKKRAFYQYYATMLEPWDGPASILFSDGDVMGAVLDRNGPASQPVLHHQGRPSDPVQRGGRAGYPRQRDRLQGPSASRQDALVDTVKGELVDDDRLKADYASRQPYGEWLDRTWWIWPPEIPNRKVPSHTPEELVQLQKAFGYQYEDVSTMILPMAKTGGEPAGAMAATPRWPC